MAMLRDSSGQYVIDEAEAASDIRNIEQARRKLIEAKQLLNASRLDRNHMFGATRNALEDKFRKMNRDLDKWGQSCSSAARYINSVVEKYKRIDREYARKAKEMGGK